MKKQRTLTNVETELSYALRYKTGNMLEIGQLLNEARSFVEHGQWLPWLRRHTALSERTARNYTAAAAWAATWAAKSATVADFENQLGHLSPRAIYALASGKYADEIVALVLSAAATEQRHLNEGDVKEIAKRGVKAPILKEIEKAHAEAQKAEADAEAEAERLAAERQATLEAKRAAWKAAEAEAEAEAEAILDGGPDAELPPTAEPVAASSEMFHLAMFEKAIDMLRAVMTKPLSTFAPAKISTDDIEQVAAFLCEVTKQQKRRAA
jgi:hypothetical protein